jgi:hypothetical protein
VKAVQGAGLPIDIDMQSHEIPIAVMILNAADSLQGTDTLGTSKLARHASRLHPPSHPNLLCLYLFAMTMALDTAEAERSFSTVKRLLILIE